MLQLSHKIIRIFNILVIYAEHRKRGHEPPDRIEGFERHIHLHAHISPLGSDHDLVIFHHNLSPSKAESFPVIHKNSSFNHITFFESSLHFNIIFLIKAFLDGAVFLVFYNVFQNIHFLTSKFRKPAGMRDLLYQSPGDSVDVVPHGEATRGAFSIYYFQLTGLAHQVASRAARDGQTARQSLAHRANKLPTNGRRIHTYEKLSFKVLYSSSVAW